MTGSLRASPGNVRRTVVRATGGLASRDRRDDGEVVAVLERGLQPGAETDIFVVPVDVDELAQLTPVVVEALLEAWVLLIQLVERLRDIVGVHFDDGCTASELAQRAGDANFNRHAVVIIGKQSRPYCDPGWRRRSMAHAFRIATEPRPQPRMAPTSDPVTSSRTPMANSTRPSSSNTTAGIPDSFIRVGGPAPERRVRPAQLRSPRGI